ncbi:Mur ligase family protein [Brucella abortus]|nr:Mur ligase family protein [Brucella abortus]
MAEHRLPAFGNTKVPMIVVEDVLEALIGLASLRARSKAQIIAVTGSVGKTTTKGSPAPCSCPMSARVHASAASFNNHWGVPLTLARMPADVDYGVFEIGMNHHGEIRPLVKMVRSACRADYADCTGASWPFCQSGRDCGCQGGDFLRGHRAWWLCALNRDDTRFRQLQELAEYAGVEHIATFGENARADYRLRDARLHPTCSCAAGERSERMRQR